MTVVEATVEHVDEARAWVRARGIEAPREIFSSTGYVVPGVAGVWLYLTNSCLAFLECLVGNPEVDAATRDAGLDAVVERAIAEARGAGALVLMAPTMSEAVEARARKHGFTITPVRSVISMPLTEVH